MRPTAAANSWLRGGDRYVDYSYKDSPKVSINYDKDHVRKVGARILDFAANWKQITDDGWVLDCVTEGVKFDFLEQPRQCKIPSLVPMAVDMLKVYDQEVR